MNLLGATPDDGKSDYLSREQMRREGVVPYKLWDREREWREELQQVLDGIMRPEPTCNDWPSSPEAIHAGRRAVQTMRQTLADLAKEVRAAREELTHVNAQIEAKREEFDDAEQRALARARELHGIPYTGQALEPFLDACREYAIRSARARTPTASAAFALLGISRNSYYRHCANYGLT